VTFFEEETVDVWPGFVDVITSVAMFLLLGFVAVVLKGEFEKRDRVLDDAERALTNAQPEADRLANAIRAGMDDSTSRAAGALRDDCVRENWDIVCTFRDRLRFDSARWTLKPEGTAALRAFGTELKRLVDEDKLLGIVVEGHSDKLAMRGAGDMTNWELSSARAGAVVRFLEDEFQMPGSLLQAVGYAEWRPPNGDFRLPLEHQRFVAIRVRLKGSLLREERA
jgi:chemotaxis protein MotB